jgi:hypothetical protein
MLVLRLTSDSDLHGALTDDQFTIGVISGQTFFLLFVTALFGTLGGGLYLMVRGWVPPRGRRWASAVFFGSVGAAFAIRPGGVDFTLLEPVALAVALFIVIPAAYGIALVWLTERLLRDGALERSGALVAALVPLLLISPALGIGAILVIVALAAWAIGRSSPGLVALWTSASTAWIGRAVLFAVTARFLVEAVRDTVEVL